MATKNSIYSDIPIGVTLGGSGLATITDHSLLIGSGTGAITPISVGAVGTILTGVAASDPTWTTATYPATAAIGDILVASAANVIGVVAGAATANHVLTANGAGSAPTFQANPSAAAITLNTQTGDYTLVLGDAGKCMIMNKATALTLTVPKHSSVAFPVGTVILMIQYGAGTLSVAPVDGDVSIVSADTLTDLYDQYSCAAIIKIVDGSPDVWQLGGDLA